MRTVLTALRSALFVVVFLFWTLVPTVAFLWILLLKQDRIFGAIRFWQASMTWLTKVVVGIDYRVEGAEYVPEGACLIAAKHQSAFETCLLNVLFFNPAIVLKKELTYVPVWGWYAKASGLIPIDRKAGMKALSTMIRAARAARDAGRKIVIFPQGTRVRPGVRKPYKVGVAALYQDLNLPVVPMAVNSGLFWPKGRFLKKPGTVIIRFLPPIEPGLSRSAFMHQLEDQLEAASDELSARAG